MSLLLGMEIFRVFLNEILISQQNFIWRTSEATISKRGRPIIKRERNVSKPSRATISKRGRPISKRERNVSKPGRYVGSHP